jgi:hypothetical protein
MLQYYDRLEADVVVVGGATPPVCSARAGGITAFILIMAALAYWAMIGSPSLSLMLPWRNQRSLGQNTGLFHQTHGIAAVLQDLA